jgi:hypothetical protein
MVWEEVGESKCLSDPKFGGLLVSALVVQGLSSLSLVLCLSQLKSILLRQVHLLRLPPVWEELAALVV